MSHRDKLEQVLEYIINEEAEAASDLLHQIVVQKARDVYEELVEAEEPEDEVIDEEVEEEEGEADEELEEGLGGDMKDDFAQEIAQDEEEIDSDEMYDAEDAEGEEEVGAYPEEEEEVEDRVEDLETALADLRAEFDQLMSAELEEPQHEPEDFAVPVDDMGGEEEVMPPEEEGYYESVSEATKLQDQVADAGMGQEGKYSGTGKNSESPKVTKEAPYTKAPSKTDHGGKPTQFAKASGDGKQVDKTAKKDSCEDNINVPEKSQTADLGKEGKFSGTGKNSKAGTTHTSSPLTKKPS